MSVPLNRHRILVVGEETRRPAEGMQVVTSSLVTGLRNAACSVETCRGKDLLVRFPGLLRWRPTAIIFAHGPGAGVLFYSALFHRLTKACLVWLAPRPDLDRAPRLLVRFAHADCVLASRLDSHVASIIARCGGRFTHTVHGVDRKRYFPTGGAAEGVDLKSLFGLKREAKRLILLHVGHLRPNRGLESLADLKNGLRERAEIIVIGSPVFAPDPRIVTRLTDAGVIVKVGYVDDLRPYYVAADIFLFPTSSEAGGAIDAPQTVIEALACGTPVISTPYGSLPSLFGKMKGVSFTSEGDFCSDCLTHLAEFEDSGSPVFLLGSDFDVAALPAKVLCAIDARSN